MTATHDNAPPATEWAGVRRLARSWLPTALGSSMLAWEIPLVAAITARMADGASALAAFGAGLSVLFVVNSPALALAPLIVAELAGQGSRRLLRRAVGTGLAGCAALLVPAALPGVSTGFPALLGLPADLHDAFRTCLLSFATAPLAVALRRYQHGRLIAADTTRPIAVATGIRIAATTLVAFAAWRAGLPAAATGGIALSAGAWAEAAYLAAAARVLPPVPAGAGRRLAVQHARITSTVLLNMSPSLITTVVLTRSAAAEDSLTVWPVLYGLVSLGMVPLSDLDTVGAAFLRRSGRPRILLRFTALLTAALLALAALVALTPLARWYVAGFSNVPDGPADLGLRWIAVLAVVPALWAVRGRLRALVIAGGDTRTLPRAAVVHLAGLIGCGLLLTRTSLPGVGCASLALTAALLLETAGLAHGRATAAGRHRDAPTTAAP
ncbi:hypothetical protein [Streptomyces sp. JB150]|uniref:hypothetical protein n=1 Tax=Streptomyces sp. JB150 TaxID=2714844 RepID=UPI0014078BD9|nr:hypothetical protein [Streptomyces sp. JB150]QIJ62429.1 hypothetical protein G7Z13_10540 [Streptomyces sp. JB150]